MSNSQHSHRTKSNDLVPPGTPSWVTADLIESTIRVWQPFYSHQLIPEDALEMIMAVDRLFEVMSRESGHEEVRRSCESE